MGASRLKPLTVKEIQKLAATPLLTIKHGSRGGVPGFVLVRSPACYCACSAKRSHGTGAIRPRAKRIARPPSISCVKVIRPSVNTLGASGSDPLDARSRGRFMVKLSGSVT